jgi:hypothetical protein
MGHRIFLFITCAPWPRDAITCARDSYYVRTRICIAHLDPDRDPRMNSSTPRVCVEPTAVRGKWFFEITRQQGTLKDHYTRISFSSEIYV